MDSFSGLTPDEVGLLRFSIPDGNNISLGRVIGLGEPTPGHVVTLPGRSKTFKVALDETLSTTLVRTRFYETYVQGKTHRLFPNLCYTYPETANFSTAPFCADAETRLIAGYEFSQMGHHEFEKLGYKVRGVAPIPLSFESGKHNVMVMALIVDELYPKKPTWFSHLDMAIGKDFYKTSPLLFRPSTLRQKFELNRYGMPRMDIFPRHAATVRLKDRALIVDIAAYTEAWGAGEKREGRSGYGLLFRRNSGYNASFGPEFVLDTARTLCTRFGIEWIPTKEDELLATTQETVDAEKPSVETPKTDGEKHDKEPTKSRPIPPTDPLRAALLMAIIAINQSLVLRHTTGIYFDRLILNTSSPDLHHAATHTLFHLESKNWPSHPHTSLLRLLLAQIRSVTTSFLLQPARRLEDAKELAERASKGQFDPPVFKHPSPPGENEEELDDEAEFEKYEEQVLKDKRLDEDKPTEQRDLIVINGNAGWMGCVHGMRWARLLPDAYRVEEDGKRGGHPKGEVRSRRFPWGYVLED